MLFFLGKLGSVYPFGLRLLELVNNRNKTLSLEVYDAIRAQGHERKTGEFASANY